MYTSLIRRQKANENTSRCRQLFKMDPSSACAATEKPSLSNQPFFKMPNVVKPFLLHRLTRHFFARLFNFELITHCDVFRIPVHRWTIAKQRRKGSKFANGRRKQLKMRKRLDAIKRSKNQQLQLLLLLCVPFCCDQKINDPFRPLYADRAHFSRFENYSRQPFMQASVSMFLCWCLHHRNHLRVHAIEFREQCSSFRVQHFSL